MKQETISDVEYSARKRKTKREEFLEIMDEIIPWEEWVAYIAPYYPSGKRGRPPKGIEKMLRMPALATVAIFSFMFTWNDFMGPLLYINNKMAYTLSYGLRTFQLQSDSKWHLTMAASVVVAIPSLVLFFCCQKYFIEGIALTGLKE